VPALIATLNQRRLDDITQLMPKVTAFNQSVTRALVKLTYLATLTNRLQSVSQAPRSWYLRALITTLVVVVDLPRYFMGDMALLTAVNYRQKRLRL